MSKFINRAAELARLRELYASDGAELAVVWGRRRIGKTRLVSESLRDRNDAVYHQATETTAKCQLKAFVADASEVYPDITRLQHDWEILLEYLVNQDAIIVLDEFPYLADADEQLPSLIQRLWDHDIVDSSTTLVLTGSAIGMMHDLILNGTAPMYGRISQNPSGKFPIDQLAFGAAMEFFPEYDPEEQIFAYGVYGGVPHYFQTVDDTQSLEENITRTLLAQQGSLHEEPELTLRMEVNEVKRFFAIFQAIAKGNRTRNEIAGDAGIDANSSSYYLDRLEDLELIEPDYPVTADPTRSRKRRYRISDHLFRFWFRFVHGRGGRYEMYGDTAYSELVEPELPDFVSDTFEQLCLQAVPTLYPDLRFTNFPGRWWHQEHEIDIVGLTAEETLLVGEVKFTSQPVGYSDLSRLRAEAQHIDWTPPAGGDPQYEYALFSRSGFNQSVQEAATEDEMLRLFTLEEVVEELHSVDV
ncbi:ATPase [Natrialba chahannaoensis JCM 10990]|uniref:ATPase n=1 Tax=Natrialba chahannaoensis JCM 10990 TaxID=1227492 RepID=M0B7E4_9EURY|nr:ATP-binding protein [Natrialba chahannaoensis]ELZ06193.1 ATPase [Natrialba chahannaoensis JCM 10990]